MSTSYHHPTSSSMEEYVIKRDGRKEPIRYDKISGRLSKLRADMGKFLGREIHVSILRISKDTISRTYNGITTSELDEQAAEISAYITDHPDYGEFAGAILVSNLEANNRDCIGFAAYAEKAYNFIEGRTGQPSPLISEELLKIAKKYGHLIDKRIVMERNYLYDYFSFKTLYKGSYLLSDYRMVKKNKTSFQTKVPFETPQHMWMRVALGIHGWNIEAAFQLYDQMSLKHGTMATPTLFNSGTPHPQNSSCFLIAMKEDSIPGIYDTLTNCALISQQAGGIGLHVHNVRAKGSYIRGTHGTSNGLVPMLRVFNNTARYVDQCFHPDTFVLTQEGFKCISEVHLNDHMLTIDGSFQKVQQVIHHPHCGLMLNIETTCSLTPTAVTEEHPVWTLPAGTSATRLSVGRTVPEFIEIGKLHVGDLIGYPIPLYEDDAYYFTEHDCRLLGILIGGGTIDLNNNMSVKCTRKSTSDFVWEYLLDKFIEVVEAKYDNYSVLTWKPWENFPVSCQMIYHKDASKTIPRFALHLPKVKIAQIILGILETVGDYDEHHITLKTSPLNYEIRYMLLRLGVVVEVKNNDMFVPKVLAVTELLGILPDADILQYLKHVEWNGSIFCPITSINEFYFEGNVVDFHIASNPNFLTELGLFKNGGNKRAGSFAIYLELWHPDIFEFLDLKKPHGSEDARARDLFYALWTCDLFWRRVTQAYETNEIVLWSLMDPNVCKGLSDVYGLEFETLYAKYEQEKKYERQVNIKTLVEAIMTAQIETGTPYILNKDACNRKSNQKNLGTIKSSNLCSEIVEYSSPTETAVCNLASLSLPSFVEPSSRTFNFTKLYESARIFTRALNRVVDINMYPIESARVSNMRHRPLGLGVQGLADVFCLMNIRFGSVESQKINRDIAETIYFAAMTESHAMAVESGPYPSIDENGGAPIRHGIFQFDLWKDDFANTSDPNGWQPNPKLGWDWADLRVKVMRDGVRNSLTTTAMPTASTSAIMGNTESFEPYYGMIFIRSTKAGEFVHMCRTLVEKLVARGLWSVEYNPDTEKSTIPLRDKIIANRGSIQSILEIPEDIRQVFVTIQDIKLQDLTLMARDRSVFTDQSISLNVHFKNKDNMMPSLLKYMTFAWKLGLKTISYYTRTIQASEALNFTGSAAKTALSKGDECTMCSA